MLFTLLLGTVVIFAGVKAILCLYSLYERDKVGFAIVMFIIAMAVYYLMKIIVSFLQPLNMFGWLGI